MAKAILSKKNNIGSIIILDFNIHCRATAVKTAWYWHKIRHEGLWNRIENPDTNTCSSSHLNFDKGAQNMHWRKDNLFKKWCFECWVPT
jgi:hypothetical protein